jgi:hypothetical protein
VLVSLPTDSNLAASAQTSGNDVLFTDSSGIKKLNHEIEQYTSSNGQLIAWVQVASVSPTTDTVIYMYYGNSSAGNQQSAAAVWSNNYAIVNHFKETSGNISDSSGNRNVGTPTGGASSTSAGLIGNGYSFDGLTGLVTIANSSTWATTTTDMTLEFWFKPSAASSTYHNLISMGNWGSSSFIYELSNGLFASMAEVPNPWASAGCTTNALSFLTTPDGHYHHLATVYTGNFFKSTGLFGLYVDGVLSCSSPYPTGGVILGQNSSPICLGGACDMLRTGGNIDEFKLSVGASRSAGWITTEYNNQRAPSSFYSIGLQQAQ